MSVLEIEKEYENLIGVLQKYSHSYYVLDNPIIDDSEYDLLYQKLLEIENNNPHLIKVYSPSQRIGDKPLSQFNQITHNEPLYSLDNAFSHEDLDSFDERVRKNIDLEEIEYVAELKIDGLAVSITYEDGFFKQAATRGDGKVGEDVSLNIKTIKSIPINLKYNSSKKTPKYLNVRGEVFISKKHFKLINEKQLSDGLPQYANPRNLAAGSLRQLDPVETSKRSLDSFLYSGVVNDNYIKLETHHEVIEYLSNIGFKTNNKSKVCKNISEVKDYCDKWEEEKKYLDYETDGIVIKVNKIEYQNVLGYTAKSPKWAIAYKYPSEKAMTVIRSITNQVGRTGALTPVAELEPVNISGSLVSRATLHNYEELTRKDIRVGDNVIVHKAGEIIPEVINVVTDLRTGEETKYILPDKCPSCKSLVQKNESNVIIRCTNKSCPEQIKGKIIHFISKYAFNIENIGPSLVEQLIQNNLVNDFSDIFSLNYDSLINLERMGEKSVNKVLKNIESSKEINLENFIYALGINLVGKETAKLLAYKFRSMENLINSEVEEIEKIDGLGNVTAESIFEYFRDKENLTVINKINQYNVFTSQISDKKSSIIGNDLFKGLKFVFTGNLKIFSRDKAKEKVEVLGGKVTTTVTKKTDYVIVGDKPGSKYNKAVDLNVKILNETEFLELISKDLEGK